MFTRNLKGDGQEWRTDTKIKISQKWETQMKKWSGGTKEEIGREYEEEMSGEIKEEDEYEQEENVRIMEKKGNDNLCWSLRVPFYK
jgi:hypothetical protein